MRTSPLPLIAGSRQGESRMRRLLSRTSITIDEAVSILLGWTTGPIDLEPKDETEDAEANVPAFCLRETLEDELEVLAGEYGMAKLENQPAQLVENKFTALQNHEALIGQANAYLCAIENELNKGEQSVLKVDRDLSNAAYTYITLHSFNEWVKRSGRDTLAGAQPMAVVLADPSPQSPEPATQPKPRTKLREQESLIVAEIERQGFDPLTLPKHQSGKSGVKAAVRSALSGSPLFKGKTTFDKAWERVSKDGRIAMRPDPSPHK